MKHPAWSGLLRSLPMVLVLGILLAGCGDDNGGEPKVIRLSDFEGAWVALEYRATSVQNPLISAELIGAGGAFAFEADDAGAFEGRGFVPASLAGETLELPFQGDVELISQDTLLVTFTPQYPPFLTQMRGAFTLAGNTLTIYDPNATFDFGMGGGLEPVIFEGTLVKNDGSYPPIIFTEDFEGIWEAISYTATSAANPQVSIETIALGARFVFDVSADGTAIGDADIPAALAGEDMTFEDFPAAFEIIYQDTMMIAFTPEIPPFLTNTRGYFTLVGDTYTLTDENASFNFGGGLEDAIAEVVMERTGGGQ
jgi:hypothetical protein